MSAALSNPTLALAAFDWSRWIDAREAALILGVNRNSLTRLCGDELHRAGLAMMAKGPEGGISRWWIARAYNKALAAGPVGEGQRIPELFWTFTEEQQRDAWARVACVKALGEAKQSRPGEIQTWIDTLALELSAAHPQLAVSARSLRRWHAAYLGPADILKLIDKRGGNTRGEPDPAAWAAFVALYLSERQVNLTECWRRVNEEAKLRGWRWTSETGCRRLVDRKLTKQDVCKARDPERYRTCYRTFLEQDPEGFAAGECWIGDHCQLDMICRIGTGAHERFVRPWLTAWMDWRTRRIMGFTIVENPNSTAILAALRHGLLAPDLVTMPSHVWIDNGKDYDCRLFHGQTKRQRQMQRGFRANVDEASSGGVLSHLGIEAHFSIPHNPNGKSRLEVWFGHHLHELFDKLWPTYCGHDHGSRPEYLSELIAAGTHVPDFNAVVKDLTDHIAGYNLNAKHHKEDMQGFSPTQALAEWVTTRRIARDPDALRMFLLKHHEPVRVGKNGISIRIGGKAFKYGQHDPRLARFKGATLDERPIVHVLYDPQDMSTIHVFDGAMKPVGEVRANELYGRHVRGDEASEERIKAAVREQRRYNKLEKEVAANRHLAFTSTYTIAARAAQAGAAQLPVVNPDAAMTPVQTALDGYASGLRKAAGAECDALPIADDEPLMLGSGFNAGEDDDIPDLNLVPAAFAGADDDDDDLLLSRPLDQGDETHLLDELS